MPFGAALRQPPPYLPSRGRDRIVLSGEAFRRNHQVLLYERAVSEEWRGEDLRGDVSMQAAMRLARYWSWLPTFRAVAETQHLPSAAAILHVTPAAISRTIRLLEDDLGRPLFDRVGRGLVLNDAGRHFLGAVRVAMRLVDEGYERLIHEESTGRVFVSAPGPLVPPFVLPALSRLSKTHPGLRPVLATTDDPQVRPRLHRGTLDVALVDIPLVDDELQIERLFELEHAVFCGPGHPLHVVAEPDLGEILAHPFVTPPLDANGIPVDAWPAEQTRRVGLVVHRMRAAIDACKGGYYLAALPVLVARLEGLRRLELPVLPSSTLYLVRRRSLELKSRADIVADALRAVAMDMALKPPAPSLRL